MRLKHNKKRNTAFVYEALVRELTESVVKNNNTVANCLRQKDLYKLTTLSQIQNMHHVYMQNSRFFLEVELSKLLLS